jgi:hypothetical protein
MRQCNALERLGAMREFGGVGFEEFSASRRVVVEVAHFDHRAGEQRGGLGCSRPGSAAESPGVRCCAAVAVLATLAVIIDSGAPAGWSA